MFGLCDCNNFFVSCERVFNPSLEGRPVIVVSNNDGCVIARSNETKALGIGMGQPLYQIKSLIKEHNIAIYSSNYVLYGDMSSRVFQTLRNFTPQIEIYSIDEAFIDFSGIEIDTLKELGKGLVKRVGKDTGIPVSIGISPTKTLAKIASKLCKKYPKLEGCCLMYRDMDIRKVLSSYPIDDIWGIGKRYSTMLKSYGIESGLQFRECSEAWVKSKMGIVGVRTWRELHGINSLDFTPNTPDRQSITISRSFAKELTTFDDLREMLSTFVSMACVKLRKQHSLATKMDVFIYTNRHRADQPQNHQSITVVFPVATDSTLEILSYATQSLTKIFSSGYGYKKAGVLLHSLVKKEGVQGALFDNIDRSKHDSLMKSIDAINEKYGKSTVSVSSQSRSGIKMNREHLSQNFTSSWDDIIKVKV